MKVHIWLRRKAGMSDDDFRDYWLTTHAPLTRGGYEHLQEYRVSLVTRVPEGQERPYDGVAELTWADRNGFKADMASEAAKRSTQDLGNFTDSFGLLFIEEHAVT